MLYHFCFVYCRGGGQPWHVFYHFVGAVPGSTELERMLKRLLKELKVCDVRDIFYNLAMLAGLWKAFCFSMHKPTNFQN